MNYLKLHLSHFDLLSVLERFNAERFESLGSKVDFAVIFLFQLQMASDIVSMIVC